MADAFEKQLEDLVGKMARELAHQIAALMLQRLGIGESLPLIRRGRPPGAAVAKAEAPRKGKRGRPPGRPSHAGGSRRSRVTASEKAQGLEAVARVVAESNGLSVSEIERRAKLSRGAATAALKTLKTQGRVFMGGTRRFARYGSTQARADQASIAARKA